MIQVGRLCVKLAGRDAGKKCVIVDTIDDSFVLIDGQTRRKKCNISHLELLDKVLPLEKGATHEEVVSEFKNAGIDVQKKAQPRTAKKQ